MQRIPPASPQTCPPPTFPPLYCPPPCTPGTPISMRTPMSATCPMRRGRRTDSCVRLPRRGSRRRWPQARVPGESRGLAQSCPDVPHEVPACAGSTDALMGCRCHIPDPHLTPGTPRPHPRSALTDAARTGSVVIHFLEEQAVGRRHRPAGRAVGCRENLGQPAGIALAAPDFHQRADHRAHLPVQEALGR